MKIGILTFHASHNYGSMLQAYSLQQALMNLGYKSEIINLRTQEQKDLITPEIDFRYPRATLSKIVKHPFRTISLTRKYNRFESFLKNDLVCSKELHNHDEVETYIKEQSFDTIIVGSDQIWNTYCWDFNTSYLLDFDLPIRRIAYAPSLGSKPESIPDDKKEMLKRNWSRFDYLSTREERGSRFVSDLTGRLCDTVLDPTLLLKKEDFTKLITENKKQRPYILYYTPREEPGTFEYAKQLSQQLNLPIVVTQNHPDYVGDNIIHINDCGPKEFLNLINNASCTIGNSFHLLAFSLIFRKEFIMLSSQNDSRMLNVLKPLGLEERLIIVRKNECLGFTKSEIDFEKIKHEMNEIKSDSIEYLENSLL